MLASHPFAREGPQGGPHLAVQLLELFPFLHILALMNITSYLAIR